MPISGDQRPRYCIWCTVSVRLVEQKPSQCSHPTRQRPTSATNHIQQNQNNTPNAVTRSLFSWNGHNDARNMLRQKLIINIWLLHLVGFFLSLSLHTLLTMHGHRNLKRVTALTIVNFLWLFLPDVWKSGSNLFSRDGGVSRILKCWARQRDKICFVAGLQTKLRPQLAFWLVCLFCVLRYGLAPSNMPIKFRSFSPSSTGTGFKT